MRYQEGRILEALMEADVSERAVFLLMAIHYLNTLSALE